MGDGREPQNGLIRLWLGLGAAACLSALTGCVGNGRAPSNLRLEPDTDSTVKISWTVPVDASPDKYVVFFRVAGETSYSLVAETTADFWIHNPGGATGWYRVEAKYGDESYAARTTPGTVPVWTDTVALVELGASGNSGFGWDPYTGHGRTCSMAENRSAGIADFYVTDFHVAQVSRLPYSIASPDMGPSDPGSTVPADSWRVSAFTDPQPGEDVLLPPSSPASYFNYTDIVKVPFTIGCHTADGNYALVKVISVDTGSRRVLLETWYQLLPGLRLTRH
jgi:hypothetical protein